MWLRVYFRTNVERKMHWENIRIEFFVLDAYMHWICLSNLIYAEFLSEDFDFRTWKSFHENICQHLISWEVFDCNFLVFNYIWNKIQFDVEVLCPCMLQILISYSNGRLIVWIKFDWKVQQLEYSSNKMKNRASLVTWVNAMNSASVFDRVMMDCF